jgi:hypothetical protein
MPKKIETNLVMNQISTCIKDHNLCLQQRQRTSICIEEDWQTIAGKFDNGQ